MSEYRTVIQFEEILESMQNGNWSQAAEECVEYGFYANDLLQAADQTDLVGLQEDNGLETYKDLVLLIEAATKLRLLKELRA